MKTTISELRGAVAYWASSSYTATADDPCCGHSADIAEAVYDALEDAWDGESAQPAEPVAPQPDISTVRRLPPQQEPADSWHPLEDA